MTIEEQVHEIRAMKAGNQEVALFYMPDDQSWTAMIGNTMSCVWLGEASGEFEATGPTIEAALNNLREAVRTGARG